MDFKTLQGDSCRVSLLYEGFSGSITTIYGGSRPFVLKEFNSDEDLFKPIRPQLAEIEILGGSTNLSINDFLANTDTDIEVRFYFIDLQNPYWIGYMLQDDFQEVWINTSNIITLRATEAIGLLKGREIKETNGNELSGKYNFLEMIQIAMNNTSQNFTKYYVFSNLFHTSMTDTSTNTGLDQAFFNSKTFMLNSSEYDNCYNVLEQINKSWSQTIYMYNGYWYIFRQEELNTPTSQNIRGFVSNSSTRTAINRRYDIEAGIGEEIKPISPDMLRFIKRKTKKDTIQFNYSLPSEILCNQTLSKGSLITSTSTYKTYNVTSWGAYTGTRESPTATTKDHYRKETLDTFGNVTDNYLYLDNETTGTNFNWWQSCDVDVSAGDIITLSFKWRWNETGVIATPVPTFKVGQLLYKADASPQFRASLDNTGQWIIYSGTWDSPSYTAQTYFTITPNDNSTSENGYITFSVTSQPVIRKGIVRLLLSNTALSSYDNNWKDIEFSIDAQVNGINISDTIGVQSIFTKTDNLNNFFQDDIYFDDSPNQILNGSIFESDETTLTSKIWYRYRFNTEEFGFRKQNTIAKWTNNRFNRNKIDVNFYGLKYNSEPIGLINTIKFVDDDPNKVYAILNLKEIDFASSTWSATLLEVYNSETDQTTITYDSYEDKYLYK